EAFDVVQQGGKTMVRVTTKEPLGSVPPNFAVAKPARIAFAFAGPVNGLGRASQHIGPGELRSMNLGQGAERPRRVLNWRRPVGHESSLDAKTLLITLVEPAVAQASSAQVSHFAQAAAAASHQIRGIDFRRGRSGEGRIVVDLSDAGT